MILLDTHIWIWWVDGHSKLPANWRQTLDQATENIGVSILSCWEVAKLVKLGRIKLTIPVYDWITEALAYYRVQLLPLTPEIVVKANELPELDHKDPVDQILIATALVHRCPIMTLDRVIQNYRHVEKFA